MAKAVNLWQNVVKLAVAAQSKGADLWNAIVAFDAQELGAQMDNDQRKEAFKAREAALKEAEKINLQSIGAYRSAKSVVLAAHRHAIVLVQDGKPRGKSEVEKEIKEARGEVNQPIDNVKRAFVSITNALPKLDKKDDVAIAYGLAKAALDAITKRAQEVMHVKGGKDVEKALEKKEAA